MVYFSRVPLADRMLTIGTPSEELTQGFLDLDSTQAQVWLSECRNPQMKMSEEPLNLDHLKDSFGTAVKQFTNKDAPNRSRALYFKLHATILEEFKSDVPDNPVDWDEYYSLLAFVVSLKSKDVDGRKVGAVIVCDNLVVSTGYNGFPRNVADHPNQLGDKDTKRKNICHAETNAIFNAARSGTKIIGGTLYVTDFPCLNCSQAIIQAGIERVFTYGNYWAPGHPERAEEILNEAGVHVQHPTLHHGIWEYLKNSGPAANSSPSSISKSTKKRTKKLRKS